MHQVDEVLACRTGVDRERLANLGGVRGRVDLFERSFGMGKQMEGWKGVRRRAFGTHKSYRLVNVERWWVGMTAVPPTARSLVLKTSTRASAYVDSGETGDPGFLQVNENPTPGVGKSRSKTRVTHIKSRERHRQRLGDRRDRDGSV